MPDFEVVEEQAVVLPLANILQSSFAETSFTLAPRKASAELDVVRHEQATVGSSQVQGQYSDDLPDGRIWHVQKDGTGIDEIEWRPVEEVARMLEVVPKQQRRAFAEKPVGRELIQKRGGERERVPLQAEEIGCVQEANEMQSDAQGAAPDLQDAMPGPQGHGRREKVEDVAASRPGLPVVAVVVLHEKLRGALDLAPASILVVRNAVKPAKIEHAPPHHHLSSLQTLTGHGQYRAMRNGVKLCTCAGRRAGPGECVG